MVDIDSFRKKLSDPKEQEKIREWAIQYARRLEESALCTKEIIGNDNYINWLIEFTSDYQNFSDDSWLYCPEEISEEDRNKVSILSNFFEGIDNYANMNYLPFNETEFGHTYLVRHNNVILEVGMAVGQGTVFYVSRKDEEVATDVIDFKDIQEGKKTQRAEKIDDIFLRLETIVDELSQEKVSPNMVLIKTNNILNKKR